MEPAARVELTPPLYKSGDTTINLHRREALRIRTETESGLGRFPLPIGIVLQVGGTRGTRNLKGLLPTDFKSAAFSIFAIVP